MHSIEHIKQNLPIPDILPESRDKQTIKCPLPGHRDRTPSFHHYPETNSFYCFGCGRGGSVIDLLIYLNGWTLAEAIQHGKEKLGISDREMSAEEITHQERLRLREEILGRVTQLCYRKLWKAKEIRLTSQAKQYLTGRGWSEELLKAQNIGFIDVAAIRKSGKISDGDLELAGLLVRGKDDQLFPLASSPRIWFPIFHRQRVVYGVCGKFLDNDKEPDKKYKNLASGPLGIGSRQFLYNINAAYKKEEVFICEGIPDTLTALTLGLNAVGTLGAGNIPDAGLFKHFNRIFIIPDNDENENGYWAAIEAAMKIYKKLCTGDVFILQLPKQAWQKNKQEQFHQAQGEARLDFRRPSPKAEDFGGLQSVKDLNDWFKLGYTRDDFSALIRKAEPILDHYIGRLAGYNASAQYVEKQLDEYVYPLISTRGPIVQKQYIDQLAKPKNKGGLGIGKTISREKLNEIAKSEKRTANSESTACQRVDHLRRERRGMNEYELSQRVSEVILEDLKQSSTLYTDEISGKSYVFKDKMLIEISRDSRLFRHLLYEYGINPSDRLFNHLTNELQIHAETKGEKAEIHIFCHYNPRSFTLYICANPGQMYRITEDRIDMVDNGEDGVLLLPEPYSAPLEIADELEEGLYERIILDPLIFVQNNLTADDKRLLLDMAIRMVFFKSVMPTRIIPALIGQKGSKKSSTWRKMMKLFFGPKADIFQLPKNEEDFITLMVNHSVVVLDQVDQHKKWLNDCLAILATGGIHTRRELYTTIGLKEAPLNAFVFLASREPHFKRDDVAERLLLLKVDRLEDEKLHPEHEVNREVNENRAKLWRALLERLQEMIRALKLADTFDPGEFDHPFRMADFGSFILKWGKLKNRETEVREILARLSREQLKFTTEDDILYSLFLEWIERDGKEGKVFKGPEMHLDFMQIAEEQKMNFPFPNSRSFGRHFARLIPFLKHEFAVDVSEKGHVKEYLFHKKGTIS